MVFIGYHASHEQLPPSALLDAVVNAERVGFDGAFSADHLEPWTRRQGHSGNTIAWLGAALARTSFPIEAVLTPGYRYHPVIAAHAVATLAEMFPGRYAPALGSGELLNEHVIGGDWPEKDERTARLGECVDVMSRLLRGEEVTQEGRIVVDRARLWSLPPAVPALRATATSTATATWAAAWADGIVTVGTESEEVAAVLDAYRAAGGVGDSAVQVHFALEPDLPAAVALVREQWLHGVVTPPEAWDIAKPEEFERLAGAPSDDELQQHVLVASDIDVLADRIADIAGGFDRVYLHEISQDQDSFLEERAGPLLAALRLRFGGAA
ncbi:LLM class flavin-dependent oxidoreductase [Pseudoclavibacter terrae]|uniref:LLM class flavin-dependent oxidoreductase n=1 Tax=Pseudoclavibacter terrae TaxID=1530195 RepID=A0A7J5B4K6_9MICO|nr:LLM class flavin-dependent oxidoreductase [Pseudoclavibacter terrae]KAB1638495.1 LLM class flavin-dependent oxidoreductase [Pseudoclavibacter terrae]